MSKYTEANAWDMFIGGAPIAAGLFLLYIYITLFYKIQNRFISAEEDL